MNDSGINIASLAFIMMVFSIGGLIGTLATRSQMRIDAVKANAAHYVLDENNERQFRWGPKGSP